MRLTSLLTMLMVGFSFAQPLAEPAHLWYNMYYIWLFIAVVIYLVVFIPGAYFLIKYRYRKGVNEEAQHVKENPALEVLWTIIPVIIVIYTSGEKLPPYLRLSEKAIAYSVAIKVSKQGNPFPPPAYSVEKLYL